MVPIYGAATSLFDATMKTALTDGFSSIQLSVQDVAQMAVPTGLIIFGLVLAIKLGKKVFTAVTG